MEIQSQEEAIEKIIEYATQLCTLQLQKKEIDEQIKEMKVSWKEDGVNVSKVTKCLNKLKADAKKSESDKFEEELIEEKLAANETIQDKITMLNG